MVGLCNAGVIKIALLCIDNISVHVMPCPRRFSTDCVHMQQPRSAARMEAAVFKPPGSQWTIVTRHYRQQNAGA